MASPTAPTATPADAHWQRYSTAVADSGGAEVATYGTDLPTEGELRLLGDLDGKRILDLGCGVGTNAVVFARQGAKVIAVDPNAQCLGVARERADDAGVRVELHQAELADLAFLRSDSVDAAISVMALTTVEDLARVFRQVHRVLKPEAPFVCSFPHPAFAMFDPSGDDPLRVAAPYDQSEPRTWQLGADDVVDHPRTIGGLFTTFHRSSFGIDQLLEPTADRSGPPSANHADLMRTVPATLVVRARKQGN